MSEAVAEQQTAPAEKPTQPTNGSTAESNGEKAHDLKQSKATAAEKAADAADEHENYPPEKQEKNDSDRRNHNDERGHRGDRGRGGRGDRGGRGRGFGRGRGGGGRGRGDRDRDRGGFRGGFKDRGHHHKNNHHHNVRTKFERKEESNDATEMRRQVEFYFSDSNLPIDKYLLETTGGSENKWVPLKTIHQFKRMRHFQPFSALVEAIKGSDNLEVNEANEVRRKEPLDSKFTLDTNKNKELLTSDSMRRSIYAKGFGEEKERTAFEIEEFFQPYGIRSVRLRRKDDGTFKGSVFVEFEDEDAADHVLHLDPALKWEDKELEVMTKQEYVDMKCAGIIDGSVAPKSPRGNAYSQGDDDSRRNRHDRRDRRGHHQGGFNKRKRDGRDNDEEEDWRERRERFQKQDRDDSTSRSRSPFRHPVEENAKPEGSENAEKTGDEQAKQETSEKVETSTDKDTAKTEGKADAEPTANEAKENGAAEKVAETAE